MVSIPESPKSSVKSNHSGAEALEFLLTKSLNSSSMQEALQAAVRNALLDAAGLSVSPETPSTECSDGCAIKCADEEGLAMDKFTTSFPAPLELGDAIANWKYEDITLRMGRAYPDVDLAEVLASPNADTMLRDLAITSKWLHIISVLGTKLSGVRFIDIYTPVAQRGLVVFKNQKSLTPTQLKDFTNRLGQLTGKPKDSSVHIHPMQVFPPVLNPRSYDNFLISTH